MSLPTQAATGRPTAEPAVPTSGTIRRRGHRWRPFARACGFVIVIVLGGSVLGGSATQTVVAGQAEPPKDTKAAPKADPKADAARTGRDADEILRKLLPPRSDTPADWNASSECLHAPGEPRSLAPCVPPPPCDPSRPPHPFDLVGVRGQPTCGPIYRGPCEPRSGRRHHGAFAWYHHWHDRMFDHFYRSN